MNPGWLRECPGRKCKLIFPNGHFFFCWKWAQIKSQEPRTLQLVTKCELVTKVPELRSHNHGGMQQLQVRGPVIRARTWLVSAVSYLQMVAKWMVVSRGLEFFYRSAAGIARNGGRQGRLEAKEVQWIERWKAEVAITQGSLKEEQTSLLGIICLLALKASSPDFLWKIHKRFGSQMQRNRPAGERARILQTKQTFKELIMVEPLAKKKKKSRKQQVGSEWHFEADVSHRDTSLPAALWPP